MSSARLTSASPANRLTCPSACVSRWACLRQNSDNSLYQARASVPGVHRQAAKVWLARAAGVRRSSPIRAALGREGKPSVGYLDCESFRKRWSQRESPFSLDKNNGDQ